jgi:hypothetical protein
MRAAIFRGYSSYKTCARRRMHTADETVEKDTSLFQATVISKEQFSADIVKLRLETQDKKFRYAAGASK